MPLISGKVVDEKGNAVAWARVMFSRAPVAMPEIAALTAEDGSFSVAVPQPGEYELATASDEQGTATTVVDVTAELHEIDVKLGRE